LTARTASAAVFGKLRERSTGLFRSVPTEDQVISVDKRIFDGSLRTANPLNLNGFNLFRPSQSEVQRRWVLPHERLPGDQASDESPVRCAHRYRGAHWRQSIPLFPKLNAYPMVLRFDSIAVDVEFLPLIAPVFYDDDVDPAIEIQVCAHCGTAIKFVCQSR
jgi:hypothetical protein